MKARKNFNTAKVPRTTEVFPQAVFADNFIFISGTPGFNPATGKLSDIFEEQVRQSFQNLKTILEEMGSSLEKIVKTTVFMVSGNDMPFPAGILVSVECIALK